MTSYVVSTVMMNKPWCLNDKLWSVICDNEQTMDFEGEVIDHLNKYQLHREVCAMVLIIK
jgi:hypothetical protein